MGTPLTIRRKEPPFDNMHDPYQSMANCANGSVAAKRNKHHGVHRLDKRKAQQKKRSGRGSAWSII